ncbi:MAG: HAMP domain-containing sensor histidine kinase [Gemmatimonadaceae bacterium]
MTRAMAPRTLRQLALYILSGAVIIAAYPPVMRRFLRREVFEQVTLGMANAVAITAGEVDTWSQVHRVQALTLARVAQLELEAPMLPGRSREAAFAERFGATMDSLTTVGDFSAAWILGRGNVVLARTRGAGEPSSTVLGTHVHRDAEARVVIDFVAGVGDSLAPHVVLRTTLEPGFFRRLNPTALGETHTIRSSILLRRGDSVFVAISAEKAGNIVGAQAWPIADAPIPMRLALDSSVTRGLAMGSRGAQVYYATGSIPSLGLPIVREIDESEVLMPFRGQTLLEGIFLAALVLLLAYLLQSLWNAAQLRRERELMRVRDDFVSSVSHELRTPLTQIRMYAELLRSGSMSGEEDTARALRVIEKEARRLAILVDNVLNFSRLRRRTEEMNGMVADVTEEVHQVIDAFGPLAAERAMTVRAEIAEPLHARVDSLALRQLLLNLVENAAKYGPKGQQVVIGADVAGHRVRIWVDDQGPGVPVAERSHLWEPFFRGATASAQEITGSGIGLSVVRDLVVRHGGDVAVTDAPSGGARFIVSFPRAEPQLRQRMMRAR